jgi:chaperone modulatory protein CbpM
MSVETREFLLTAHLKAEALEGWIEAGWLAPRANGEDRHFSEVDLARVQLIHDLQGVNDEAIPVILDLVDQLHGLRRVLRDLLSTVAAQGETPRRPISSSAGATHWQERE